MIDMSQIETIMSVVLDGHDASVPQTEYRIVGTAAAVMHGVQLPADDIDILLKERAGVDAFSAVLSPCKCLSLPTYLAGSRQYFSSFEVHGVEVEFSTVEGINESDTSECTGSGPWSHYSMIACGNYLIPVVCLELRLLTEIIRGRPDRYVPIWEFMQSGRYDKDLLARGLEERGISGAEQIDLTQLRHTGPQCLSFINGRPTTA